MNILPGVKSYTEKEGFIDLSEIRWVFQDNIDKRVISAAHRVADNSDGTIVEVFADSSDHEGYRIDISKNKVSVRGDSSAGAFYAIQSLSQLIKENNGIVACGVMIDQPDMAHRGFYHDITRGKIPKLDTLKELADKLAYCKINSLQLYVEHVFEFPEYQCCRERLGSISEAELIEFDEYCYERFIDLIPSLSCFGHLYHLLQDCGYSHLSELANYRPHNHYWIERMEHHTINPLKEESRNLIINMIDRYSSIFRSEYFNICCDETFDLGYDVNKDKNKGELYFNFITLLIDHLQSRGKKVMMWGDVIIRHPEFIERLPKEITFLNWGYSSRISEDRFKPFEKLKMTQIVCPGTNSWNGFCENIGVEEKNIALLARYGVKYKAKGILNTNWGDMGNICSLEMATYGLVCGASIAWNHNTVFDRNFRRAVSALFYGDPNAVEILAGLSPLAHEANWKLIVRYDGLRRICPEDPHSNEARSIMNILTSEREEPEIYEAAIERCKRLEKELTNSGTVEADYAEEALMAIRGTALLIKWNAAYRVYKLDCYVDYDKFRRSFECAWLAKNKKSELEEVLSVFDRAEQVWGELR